MHLTILTIGSRGDVQPYVALALGLQGAGHRVRLATHARFESFIREHGIDFYPLAGDPVAMMDSPAGRAWLGSGENAARFMLGFVWIAGATVDQMMIDSWEACQGTDAILHSSLAFPGYHVAEKLGLPSIMASLQPMSRTREAPILGGAELPWLGGAYNLFSHLIGEQAFWQPFRRRINRWRRKDLGLPSLPFSGPYGRLNRLEYPVLYGYSEHLLPRPSDWPEWIQITGYWFLNPDKSWNPPQGLVDFIESGSPPVYIGFGSMMDPRTDELTELACEALALTGSRGVLLSGWSGLGSKLTSKDILAVESVPHSWLFPRTAVAVHHGGSGTTAEALRAGVPNVVVPFFADQPHWARQVVRQGVGPEPIPRKKLTAKKLAQAIKAALEDEEMRARAAALGEAIRSEDGVGEAVRIIENILEQSHSNG